MGLVSVGGEYGKTGFIVSPEAALILAIVIIRTENERAETIQDRRNRERVGANNVRLAMHCCRNN